MKMLEILTTEGDAIIDPSKIVCIIGDPEQRGTCMLRLVDGHIFEVNGSPEHVKAQWLICLDGKR